MGCRSYGVGLRFLVQGCDFWCRGTASGAGFRFPVQGCDFWCRVWGGGVEDSHAVSGARSGVVGCRCYGGVGCRCQV